MTQSISGLVSGLDVNAIIAQLVTVERRSQTVVRARGTKASDALATWGSIRSKLSGLQSAALALARATDWRTLKATSSNETAATVSAGSGTVTGNLSFTVDRLAAAGAARSGNVLTGTSALVAADTGIFVAAGAAKLGFSTLASANTLGFGSHDVEVTQSSAAATKKGTAALAASTAITLGVNDTLQLSVNGSPFALTIAPGSYTPAQLAAAVQTAADTAGAAVNVTVDSSNVLTIASKREGSAATVQVTGGTALTPLNLTTDASALTGTDGKVKVGGGAENVIASIDIGGSATLNAAVGTVSAVFSGGLRAGKITGKNVDVGDGTLATVVSSINSANVGVTAAAVQVADGMYRLQITSNTTGALNGHNVAASEFHANVGGLVTLSAAQDAKITVGSGAGSYEVTAATNVISGLLPGVTVTLKSTTASPVTITVDRNVDALADKVQKLVDALNDVKTQIQAATKYDAEKKKGSPLTGDSTVRLLDSSISRAVGDAVSWTTILGAGLAGVSVDKTGKYTFDRTKFINAYNADPTDITKLFIQGGSATNSTVTFVSATDRTRAGTYDVAITTAAAQASSLGLEGTWPIASPPTVKVKVGATEVSYVVKSTDLQQDVVDGLNAAFRGANLSLVAEVSGTGVNIETVAYGASATFDVAWDGSTWQTKTGVNVVGTVNGVAGTGSGRILTIPGTDTTVGGLVIDIASTTTGALGTFTYQPGVSQRVSTSVADAIDSISGYITSSETALKSKISDIDRQVESMERRLLLFERRLRTQFATLERTLGSLQSQGNWLQGQINQLNAQASQ